MVYDDGRALIGQLDSQGFLHAGLGFHRLGDQQAVGECLNGHRPVIGQVGAGGNLRRLPQAVPAVTVPGVQGRPVDGQRGQLGKRARLAM